MKSDQPCRFRTLAQNGPLTIQSCPHCNTVTLHMGGVSLRFDPGTVEALWSTIGEALSELHAHELRELGMRPTLRSVPPRGHA